MSAAPGTSTIELWASWEGHVINGVYPLRRYVGNSDHSGVFLTESRNATPNDLAIKIVPAGEHAESQLSRWLTAAGLDHPNLVRIFEAGQCQVNGRPYLYALMEYADQDLAQLLQRRALTEDEAREMLVPTLKALAFLHEKKLAQGRVKPSNVLVVGDQLKLASDTICRVGEAVEGGTSLSAYESPEARETGRSAAGDIWALGVTICEALTRRQPLALHAGGNPVFPVDLPPAFRELAAWCLSRRPWDRPEVSELEASLRGERTVPIAIPAVEPTASPAPPAAAAPDPEASTEPVTTHSIATEPAAPAAAPIATSTAPAPSSIAPTETSIASAPLPSAQTAAGAASTGLPTASTANAAASALPPSAHTATSAASMPPSAPTGAGTAQTASLRGSIEVFVAPPASRSAPVAATASAATAAGRAMPPASAATIAPWEVSPSPASVPQAPRAATTEPSLAKSAPAEARAVQSTAALTPGLEPESASYQAAINTRPPVAESVQSSTGEEELKPRYTLWAASVVAVLVIALMGMKLLSKPSSDVESDSVADVPANGASDATSGSASTSASDDAADGLRDAAGGAPSAASSRVPEAGSAAMPRNAPPAASASTESDLSPSGINEVIPDVPLSARQTIRGRVRVAVRVIVEKDGTVFAALADNPGPSRYFERLAIDAAKKWTFAPTDSDEQRLMLVRFVFERQGTTASATALQ